MGSSINRLRKLASTCEFGLLTDAMIRDRLVIGINDKRTKGRMRREDALSLNKAVEMYRSSEITSKQLEATEKKKEARRS